jgi:hypothetical protein
MSFKGKNDLKTRELFNQRALYGGYAFSEDGSPNWAPCLTKNFWNAEHVFYGRIDKDQNVIQAKPEYMKHISGDVRSNMASGISVFNFVADAFKNLKAEFRKAQIDVGLVFEEQVDVSADGACGPCLPVVEVEPTVILKTTKINTDSPFLAYPTAVKGFSSISTKYSRYRSLLFAQFLNNYASRPSVRNQIRDFDTFVPLYIDFVKETSQTFPFLRTSHVLSRYNSPMASGMCIEIAGLKHSSDQEKYDSFISDPNFDFYKIMAAKHGFVIDKNAPWRLIADIASDQMIEYAAVYLPVETKDDMVSQFFSNDIYLQEVDDLRNMAIAMYNNIVRTNPTIYVDCFGPKCVTTTAITREREERESIEGRYDNSFWLKEYVEVKNIESKLKYSQQALDRVIKYAQDLEKSFDMEKSLGYINRKFRGISSFEGSLYYEATKLKLQEDGVDSPNFQDDICGTIRGSRKVQY